MVIVLLTTKKLKLENGKELKMVVFVKMVTYILVLILINAFKKDVITKTENLMKILNSGLPIA